MSIDKKSCLEEMIFPDFSCIPFSTCLRYNFLPLIDESVVVVLNVGRKT
jgi:hypothetical protein